MPSFNDMFKNPASTTAGGVKPSSSDTQPKTPRPSQTAGDVLDPALTNGSLDDEVLLEIWDRIKKEAFENRWTFERQWQRNIWYVLGRQWIEYLSRYGGWRDKRMAAWIPRPVTNKCKETVQAIRAMFTSITLGVNVRPTGGNPEDVSAATTADALAPVLHEAHEMDAKQQEFDFWLCTTGNAFFHTFVDYDLKYGTLDITTEQCQDCGKTVTSDQLAGAQPVCPECSGTTFAPAVDPATGSAIPAEMRPIGRPNTMVLSPLEIAFPDQYARFTDLPYIVRLRWRTKRYYESHPQLQQYVEKIAWQKAPQDHSLQLFTSLARHNDLGITPIYWSEGTSVGGQHEDGITEYEVWMKPTADYPEGLVFRIIGDSGPIVAHLEDSEALPGPLPYKDSAGKPLFTFTHAFFEHVGGRILGSGPLDQIIQKQDQLNQLDSMILLIIQRMSNPVWLEPKGAEIAKLTGMPGLVIKWNPLTVGGNAKPERIPGENPPSSLFTIREQYLKDIEELAGTFDVIKGQKPAGVEAFSALQLLVERSQARFASVFQARGHAYKDWFKFAVELEREFGPDERTKAVLGPDRGWTFQSFKRTALMGAFSVVVEDGTSVPKTSLGMRAALDHAAQLQMLNMADPDQQYEGLKLFGLTKMVPTLDIHIQAALQKQQAFEEWAKDPKQVAAYQKSALEQQQIAQQQAQVYAQQLQAATDPNQPMPQPPPPPPSPLNGTPLKWRVWYNPAIHRQEYFKWANGDHVRELLAANPMLEPLIAMHLQEILQAMAQEAGQQAQIQQAAQPQPMAGAVIKPPMQGGGRAMQNSAQNSAPAGNTAQPSQGV